MVPSINSYGNFILINTLKMPATSVVFVHFLNKKTTIEPIPLMRKKVNAVFTPFHLFLLTPGNLKRYSSRFYATTNQLKLYQFFGITCAQPGKSLTCGSQIG